MHRTPDHVSTFAAIFCLLTALASPAAAAEDRFTFYGLTPAAAGQTLQEAERALGGPLQVRPADAQRPCQLRSIASQPGVVVVVDQGVITRMDTRDRRWATVRGLRVGDTEARARQLYGKRLVVSAHPYFAKGHRLAVYSADRKFALVMESDDAGRIVTLRGGRVPAVESLEGCS